MAANSKPRKMPTIEKLAEKLNVDKSVLEAVKVSRNWGKGKEVSETEFKAAVNAFLKAPADGRKTSGKKPDATRKEGDK